MSLTNSAPLRFSSTFHCFTVPGCHKVLQEAQNARLQAGHSAMESQVGSNTQFSSGTAQSGCGQYILSLISASACLSHHLATLSMSSTRSARLFSIVFSH